MTKLLLSVHVLAAILCIGPVAVAASVFPRYVRADRTPANVATLEVLHRITRVYAVIGALVPAFGFATATSLGVLGSVWLIVSIALTATAAVLLIGVVLPGQARVLVGDANPGAPRLAMATGLFNLLWAIVVVLMIVRPGSTTGA